MNLAFNYPIFSAKKKKKKKNLILKKKNKKKKYVKKKKKKSGMIFKAINSQARVGEKNYTR